MFAQEIQSATATDVISQDEALPLRVSATDFTKYSRVAQEIAKDGQVVYRPMPSCISYQWVTAPQDFLDFSVPVNFASHFAAIKLTENPRPWPVEPVERSGGSAVNSRKVPPAPTYDLVLLKWMRSTVWMWPIFLLVLLLIRYLCWKRQRFALMRRIRRYVFCF